MVGIARHQNDQMSIHDPWFYGHKIRDDDGFEKHVDGIHFNPDRNRDRDRIRCTCFDFDSDPDFDLDHRLDLLQLLFESLRRYWMGGFDLLGEDRDFILFEHPE